MIQSTRFKVLNGVCTRSSWYSRVACEFGAASQVSKQKHPSTFIFSDIRRRKTSIFCSHRDEMDTALLCMS